MRTTSRALAAAVVLAQAVGCASLPRTAPPQVVGASVRVAEVRLPDVRLAVDLTLRNPNGRDLAIGALDATLALGGEDVGRAFLLRPVVLPAHGDVGVPLDVRGDAARVLARVGASLGAAQPLGYEVRGTLTLAEGGMLPFRRAGTLPEVPRKP